MLEPDFYLNQITNIRVKLCRAEIEKRNLTALIRSLEQSEIRNVEAYYRALKRTPIRTGHNDRQK